MLDGLSAQIRPSDPLISTPILAGNDTSRKVSFYPPFCSRRCVRFPNTFSSALLVLLTCTQGFDAVEDVRGHSDTLNPFTEQRKGVNPVRERAKTSARLEVAYIKVAPVSGCVR
ncbi:hypothetical protein TNIN_489021 [Trichonephila inaurata madagascariensis]|uniref:Uncharacterized protein n=1 Tax=Trichonephila inaurata madagascariensis TaxID=2747483 RepID=A0A8X7BUY6_9ARAC|nr:hypothetical protein TNIN_489021 [Trichonephila inaurata madagascariensis]